MPLTHPPLMRLLRSRAFLDSRFIGALSALLPGGSVLAWSHFVEPHQLEITTHSCPLPGAELAPLRVLHLSDLHFTRDNRWARGVLKRLCGVPHDLLVITGDFIHIGANLDEVERLLGGLPHPPLGSYACPGNWDRWSGHPPALFEAVLKRVGVHLLTDESTVIEHGPRLLMLVGMDDLLSGAPDPALLEGLDPALPKLVLSHTPTLFPALAARGAQLVLSGHTHGGQVRLPMRGAVWMPLGSGHYDAGWFSAGEARLFVSRGIGTSVAPLRLLCRPEAALLTI